jgi:glutamine synthetase
VYGPDVPSRTLHGAARYLPDNIYDAMDVKAGYLDLKKTSADRCARLLGISVKPAEVQYHHEIYNIFSGAISRPA